MIYFVAWIARSPNHNSNLGYRVHRCYRNQTYMANNSCTPTPDRSLTLFDLPHAWRYLHTQWRRGFGLNVSRVDDLLFVGGQFRARQWPALRALGIRAVLSLQAEREDTFHGPPPDRVLRLLVPDFHPPSIAQLREAVAFIRAAH